MNTSSGDFTTLLSKNFPPEVQLAMRANSASEYCMLAALNGMESKISEEGLYVLQRVAAKKLSDEIANAILIDLERYIDRTCGSNGN